MEKKKILIMSDLVTPTGFARVSHSIFGNLQDKYDLVGIGVNYRGDPHPYNFPIYPAGSTGHIFGEDRLVSILNNAKFDILFILNDAWGIARYLDIIKKNVTTKLPKIVVYFPVDSLEHDPEWYSNFDIVSRAVTYTEFGRSVVNDDKCAKNLKLTVIPHGVNKEIFYKKYTHRKYAKERIKGRDSVENSFIFLNANRNQPRKKLDITMEAFKLFAENKDDVLLYMHCGVRDASIDIAKLAVRLEIDNKLILTNLNFGVQSVSDEQLNDIYNSCDVGINTSLGEGWGLTSMEHAITGAPQIVPSHSACTEIFSDCGLLIPTISKLRLDNTMTVGRLVSTEELAKKMDILYSDRQLYDKLSAKSIEKFSGPKYSWTDIANQWDNLFLEVLTEDADSISE